MYKSKNGFTLIEILVTVTIMSILVGILLPNLSDLRKKARDQRRKADIAAIANALEIYKISQNPPAYPTTVPMVGAPWTVGSITYIKKMPKDPLYDVDADRYTYRYERGATDALDYTLQACLEMSNDPDRGGTPIGSNNTCPGGVDINQIYQRTAP